MNVGDKLYYVYTGYGRTPRVVEVVVSKKARTSERFAVTSTDGRYVHVPDGPWHTADQFQATYEEAKTRLVATLKLNLQSVNEKRDRLLNTIKELESQ